MHRSGHRALRWTSTATLALAGAALLGATALARPAQAQDEGRGGYRPGGVQPGQEAEFADRTVEFLADELDLAPSQKEEVRGIVTNVMQETWKKVGEAWAQGGMEDGGAGMRKVFEDVRVEMARKISAVLTPAQRREFEVLVDQFDRRAQGWEQRRRAWEDPGELFNPAPPSKRLLLDKAERALFLGPEETAAVLPLIERVLDLRQALYEGRRVRRDDLLNAARAGASPEELTQRLNEVRAAEQFQALELAAAQQNLRELLTIEQETRFVAMQVLD